MPVQPPDPEPFVSRRPHAPPFSGAWWAAFEQLTDGGVSPHLFKGVLADDAYGAAFGGASFPDHREIGDALLRLQRAEGQRRLRIYVDGERRNELAQSALDARFDDGDVFGQLRKHVKADRLAFMINDFQDRSPAFAAGVGRVLSSMATHRGMPHGGAELIVFAGNYAGTPFGAHRGYEHAFLCHVGPGDKRFPLWSPQRFRELTGSLDDVFDWEWLLPHAIDLVLEPGDLLYLPAQWFHIGVQSDYSCSVAVGLYDYPVTGWLKSAVNDVFARLAPQARPAYMPPSSTANPFREAVDEVLQDTLRQEVLRLADDAWFKLVSNGSFVCKEESWAEPELVSAGDTLKLVAPAKLCWREAPGSDRIAVYLRHRKLSLKRHPRLPEVFRALNAAGELPVEVFLRATDDAWETDAALAVLGQLTRTGGVSVERANGGSAS